MRTGCRWIRGTIGMGDSKLPCDERVENDPDWVHGYTVGYQQALKDLSRTLWILEGPETDFEVLATQHPSVRRLRAAQALEFVEILRNGQIAAETKIS